MIFAIPNPKKDFQIHKDLETVKESVKNVQLINTKYKLFKSDDILNIYTYETFEFLSLGALIIITLVEVSENKTNVNLEVQRKIGTFNQSHEVSLANQHISKLTELISESLQTDKEVMNEKKKAVEIKANEQKRKQEELEQELKDLKKMKEINPIAYYGRHILIWASLIAFFGLIAFLLFKLYSKI